MYVRVQNSNMLIKIVGLIVSPPNQPALKQYGVWCYVPGTSFRVYDQQRLYGESCYRLMMKNGQFVYMRTHGALDVDEHSKVATTFVCVNTVVGEQEGKYCIEQMKKRFTIAVDKNEGAPLPAMPSKNEQVTIKRPSVNLDVVLANWEADMELQQMLETGEEVRIEDYLGTPGTLDPKQPDYNFGNLQLEEQPGPSGTNKRPRYDSEQDEDHSGDTDVEFRPPPPPPPYKTPKGKGRGKRSTR